MKSLYSLLFLLTLGLTSVAQVPSYVPTDGLVGWWAFVQNFQDESDNGNDCVENGSVPFAEDRFQNGGSALSFSGNGNNFLRVNYSPDSYTFENGYSVSVWFVSNTTSGNRRVLSLGNTDQYGKGFHVMKNSNEIGAWFCEGSNADPCFGNWDGNANTVFEIGEWNHLLFTCDFGNLNWTLYLNGDAVDGGTSLNDFDPGQLPVIFTQTFEIGRKSGTSNNSDGWNGLIDDLGIWSKPLTELEAEALFLSYNGVGGCTNPTACNYDASANWDDDSCVPSGCMDVEACNFNTEAACDDGSCDYSCCPGPGCCSQGMYWDWESNGCFNINPADINLDGCVQLNDLLELLSVYGDCGAEESTWQCGDPLEYQGYDYETVQIGEQCWFAENARWMDSVSPSSEGSLNDGIPNGYILGYEGTSLIEGQASDSYVSFGAFYDYDALQIWPICPSNWHVSTDVDWQTLESFLGMSVEQSQIGGNWRGTTEGKQLKSESDWNGFDTYLFSVLPSGYRTTLYEFQGSGNEAWIWSPDSTEYASTQWSRGFNGQEMRIYRNNSWKHNGFSVRCVADAE